MKERATGFIPLDGRMSMLPLISKCKITVNLGTSVCIV